MKGKTMARYKVKGALCHIGLHMQMGAELN